MIAVLKNVLGDWTALGGLPIFLVLIIILFLLNEQYPAMQLLVALISCYALTIIIRAAYFKQRPVKQRYTTMFEKLDASAFPSLHSMRAGALATILGAQTVNIPLQVFFALLAALTGMTRVWLRKHDWTDVVAGLIMGSLLSIIIINII